MANTRETMGEQACLDALVADTLTTFEDDGIDTIRPHGLRNRVNLTNLTLPACRKVLESSATNDSSLNVVDMLGGSTIESNSFTSCPKLEHFVLRGNSKTTLTSKSGLGGTPIANGLGAIYVQSSLLDSYKNDVVWKNFRIVTTDEYPLANFDTISESWTELDAMTQEQIESKYVVGDKKLIDFGTKGKVYAEIAGFGHDDLTTGGKAKVTFVFKSLLEYYPMDAHLTTYSNWATSEMRSYLTSDILPLMPADLQSALKDVTKYTYAYTGSSNFNTDMETTDKLFLLSAKEVGYTSGNLETKAAKYDIFTTNNDSRKKMNQSYVVDYWWLRSNHNSMFYRIVSNRGSDSYSRASDRDRGIVLGFCI